MVGFAARVYGKQLLACDGPATAVLMMPLGHLLRALGLQDWASGRATCRHLLLHLAVCGAWREPAESSEE